MQCAHSPANLLGQWFSDKILRRQICLFGDYFLSRTRSLRMIFWSFFFNIRNYNGILLSHEYSFAQCLMTDSMAKEEPFSPSEAMNIRHEAAQLRADNRALKEVNAQLRQLDRVKDDFLCSVTHELRTPLTSIRAFAELLYDDPKMHLADRERFLGLIVSEAERLSRLVNQTLELAKIESSHTVWNGSELDLKEIIAQSIAVINPLFSKKGARIEIDLPDGLPLIRADHDRLMQVMLNLLSNAVKFIPPEKGCVRVALSVQGEELQVSVADNGPGIRVEDQQMIFEKFRQVGDTMTDKSAGSGLGLPICRRIVEHFGGRLWVESSAGQSATFSFALPLAQADLAIRDKPISNSSSFG